jgi:hypothetical protein
LRVRCDLFAISMKAFTGSLVSLLFAAWAGASPPAPDSLAISPDITVKFSSVTLDGRDVALDDLLGLVVAEDLGTLPASADVTGYHLAANSDRLFSLDTTAVLAGPLTVFPGDVVRFDDTTYSLEFNAGAEGIPNGVSIDAISLSSAGRLLLSFDTTVDLGSFTAEDEDLVQFNGSSFTLVFDGSAAGVDTGLDLNGAHDRFGGFLALSFDTSGKVGSVDFDDEDILQYDSGTGAWSMLIDYSTLQAGAPPVDANAIAVPEPAALLYLLCGIAFLFVLPRPRNPLLGRSTGTGGPNG